MTELRFPFHGWKVYRQGFGLSLLGIGFVALGLAVLNFIAWKWSAYSVAAIAGGIFSLLVGIALLLLIWFAFIYGTINVWLRWRQLRAPTVVIDADGVRFLAARRPALVPWQDVEEIHLNRSFLPRSITTKVSVRLTPDAEVVRHGPVNVPKARYLNIGLMSDLDVPESTAEQFLTDTAGSRLRVTETDRRTPSATPGYR